MLSKLLTTNGVPFYVFGARVDDIAYFWTCFSGCPDEIKNYAITLSISGQTNEKLSYHGNVHTLDDDFENIIKEERDTLMVGRKLANRLIDVKGHTDLEVTIHCLKDREQTLLKDYETESE